ncbi:MAG: TonB-dependent receptor [Prevotella sp.]|jgi:TonB-linked SusC/RagA family outer membrane protein|uniref:Receptor antigen RagA n=2 Tax=Xylanibacter ruminicola TaxID=839 RepID=D5EXZ5_XYLR2|nr:TonB-dependent receptor [Xylanibacter ruminicola]ADE83305.1 putative receptor antigen RagA [Xylanibacter ruminicola 23]MBP3246405.1 TonB-dependent receptor [Prevotella sp.]SEH83751.1 TonB-linked outer membrane protein, SusC/RagA family [Xylanibacter ruminicola]
MYKRERKVSKTMCSSLLLLSAGAMTFGSPVSVLANSVSQPLTEVTSVQQQKKVIITVVDGQNEPVVGASVMMMSSKTGVITDINGRCDIDAASGDEIRVSSIGYVAQTIKLGKGGSQRIVLLEDKQLLDEVVVVGYGTMRKSDLTGSSSTTKGSEILKMQGFNALEGLKGKAAGVNIFNNTGQPGGEMRVIIRGISTINASSSPLYIVDGVAMTDFQFLNPNDIESIEVLKDASSAAIYGARGANGVIMVTTKRGNAGKGAHIKYDGSFSVSSMARKMDVMNASEWMSAFKQGLENANQFQGMNFDTDLSKIFTDTRYFDSNGNPLYDTDWQDECSRVAVSHNHELSIQRSGENGSSVGAFLNFTDQQGILLNTYYKRVNAKLAYDDNPTKWLSTGLNLLVNHSWGNHTSDNPYGQGALRTMIEQLPWLPVQLNGEYVQNNMINTTGILKDKDNPNSGYQTFSPEGVANPVELLERVQVIQYKTQIFGNAALTFHLAKGLDLRTQLGIDYHNNRSKGYTPFQPHQLIDQGASQGAASAGNSNSLYWQEETYLTYVNDFGKHHLNAMAGASWQARKYDYFGASDNTFTDDYYGYYNLGSGTLKPSVGSDYDKWAMNSYFLRLAYNYNNTYMATVTGRYDGSSKFGQNNKYAFFPSVGLGWLASNESFLKDIETISKLKLHTSFGMTGNSEIGTYRSLATVSQSTTILGGKMVTVSYLDNMPNANLKWEKTAQWDLGFELGLFKNRLNFDISYYYKYTSDLLLNRPVPESTGYSSIMDNIGAVSNHGFDILVTAYPIQTKDFQWTSTLNLGFNKNKVEKLDEGASVDPVSGKRQILTDGFVGYDMLIREGEALSTFYGYKRAGIYDGHPENWDASTMNIPSIVGEKVTYKQRQILGNGLPDWTGSFINTFNYKNFDLTLDLQFSMGADIMQEYYHSTLARFLTNGLDRLYEEAWHPVNNPNGVEQALRLNNFGMGANNQADSDWVCDGSYLRFNLLQLGYTFSGSACRTLGISALRLYANLNNFWLICSDDYKGYDPDNSTRLGSNNWGANRQFFSYPRPKTFSFGVNVTF